MVTSDHQTAMSGMRSNTAGGCGRLGHGSGLHPLNSLGWLSRQCAPTSMWFPLGVIASRAAQAGNATWPTGAQVTAPPPSARRALRLLAGERQMPGADIRVSRRGLPAKGATPLPSAPATPPSTWRR